MLNKKMKKRLKTVAPEQELAARSRTSSARLRNPDVHQSYVIPVLDKALRIMRLLEESERHLKIGEIARTTGYSQSTIYRILRTLSAHGYLPCGVVALVQ